MPDPARSASVCIRSDRLQRTDSQAKLQCLRGYRNWTKNWVGSLPSLVSWVVADHIQASLQPELASICSTPRILQDTTSFLALGLQTSQSSFSLQIYYAPKYFCCYILGALGSVLTSFPGLWSWLRCDGELRTTARDCCTWTSG